MIRQFLELLISRSFDDRTPLPRWLESLTRRNKRLSEFAKVTSQLDGALRDSAREHQLAMAGDQSPITVTLPPDRDAPTHTSHRKSRNSLCWFVVIGTAAALLLALAPSWLRRRTPSTHAGEFSQQLTMVPGEVLRVINRATETSQSQLPKISPLANLSMPSLPDWQSVAANVELPVQREIDAWQQGWQNLRSQFSDETQEL